VHEHAVAVPLDHAVDDMVLQVGDAGDRHGGFDPFIEGGGPPAIRAAAAAPGDAEPLAVDLFARLQVVESPDAIPRFDAGRRVAARRPPPHPFAMQTMVKRLDLAEL